VKPWSCRDDLKLATNDKATIWVNLSRILQMTLIDAQDGYSRTLNGR